MTAANAESARIVAVCPSLPVSGTPGTDAARTSTGTQDEVSVPETAPVGVTVLPEPTEVAAIEPGVIPTWKVLPALAAGLTSHVTLSRSAEPAATVTAESSTTVLVPSEITFAVLLSAALPVTGLRTRQSERLATLPPPPAENVSGSEEKLTAVPERA